MNRPWIITALLLNLATLTVFGYLLLNRNSVQPPTKVIKLQAKIANPIKPKSQPIDKDYSLMVKNDLFQPSRGKAVDNEDNRAVPMKPGVRNRFRFDLRGVFASGEKHGALIAVSGREPVHVGRMTKADAEVFFQGDEIAEGCILQKVESNSVTLLYNNEVIVVELEKLKLPEMVGDNENIGREKITRRPRR